MNAIASLREVLRPLVNAWSTITRAPPRGVEFPISPGNTCRNVLGEVLATAVAEVVPRLTLPLSPMLTLVPARLLGRNVALATVTSLGDR